MLRTPEAAAQPGPALVLATPGSSVKEQIGANYARRLADHLNTLDAVDDARIGLVGVCAGGGYATRAAVMDHRIAALGTVTAGDIGRAFRTMSEDPVAALRAAAKQRADEARGAAMRRDPWIPDTLDQAREAGITDRDLLEAVEFYRTDRGFDEHSTNRLLFRSLPALLSFDAFDLVDELLAAPVQVIVGGRKGTTGAYDDGVRLQRLAPNAEPLFVVEGAGHYDLYDKPQYVDQAVACLVAFFRRTLTQASSNAHARVAPGD